MHLKHTETVVNVPGNQHATSQKSAEWICPDCDYFEEADEDNT